MAFSLNIRHLSAALEVSRCESLSEAARRIHLSQSAVTQAIARLERKLNAPLFIRTASGVLTTEAGKVFVARIARGIQWLRSIEHMVAEAKKPRGREFRRLLTNTQLRALIAVVDCGSYTRAAQFMNLTQPTVHKAVAELQSLCGLEFFRRSPQGVEPNWQARQVARFAQLFFAEITQGMEEVNELQGVMTGKVVIGALPLSRTKIVPQAVSQLIKKYPQASIHIIDGPYDEQLNGLLRGQIDVIVGALRYPPPSPDLEQQFLFSDSLNMIVRPNHWLVDCHGLTPKKLRQLNWIAPRSNTPAREVFTNLFRGQGLEPPDQVIECSSLVTIRALLRESDRVALIPAQQAEVDVEAGLLAVSPIRLEGTTRDIGLTLRKAWKPTKIQAYLLNLLRNLPEKTRTGDLDSC